MDRRQLRERVKLQLGIPSTGSGFLTDDKVNLLVEDALSRLSDDDTWPWLLTSTSVTFAASTGISTTNIVRPVHTLTIDSLPARYVGLRDYLDPRGRQWTHVWTVAGVQGRLDPAPTTNTTGTLWYFQAEPPLLDDNDTPIMDGKHLGAVVAFASHLGLLAKSDEAAAQVQYAEYEQALKAMRDDQEPEIGPGQVRLRSNRTVWASW